MTTRAYVHIRCLRDWDTGYAAFITGQTYRVMESIADALVRAEYAEIISGPEIVTPKSDGKQESLF